MCSVQAIMKALAENKQTVVSELRLANQVSVCEGGGGGGGEVCEDERECAYYEHRLYTLCGCTCINRCVYYVHGDVVTSSPGSPPHMCNYCK